MHGYGGNPISTWSDFDRLSIGRSEVRGHDLLFYEYDGLEGELEASANLFHAFMTWMFDSPAAAINKCLPKEFQRPYDFEYDEVVLVCHSLGAVIARMAMLRATKEGCPWPPKIRLLLFAPAHKGARAVELALEVTSPIWFLSLFVGVKRFKSPLIDQLKKGSPELVDLETGTETQLAGGANKHLIAHKVCFAEREHIVFNKKFCRDPEGETIRNSTHTTVCKPHKRLLGGTFLKPLDALIQSL